MKRKQVLKSIVVTAVSTLLISSLSSVFVHAAEDARKSTWTADNTPQEQEIQITPKTTAAKDETKRPTPDINKRAAATDRVIVKYKAGFSSTASSILTPGMLKTSLKLPGINGSVVKLSPSDNMNQLIDKLSKDPHVLYAEPDYKLYKSDEPVITPDKAAKVLDSVKLPDDTYFDKQWALHNTGQTPPYNVNDPYLEGDSGLVGLDIKAPEAWAVTKGSKDVVVAVIDTGVQMDHPDLENSIWTNPKERPGNGIDDDYNNYVDDVHGWNFVDHSNQVYSEVDGDLHGTAVAGIIAGAANNGIGIAGIAPNVKIMPLKYIGAEYGYLSDLIEAIEYAQNNGAKIASVNAEMYAYSQALKDVIDASTMLFINGAGNQGLNTDGIPSYPAAFHSPNMLSVTSVDNEGNLPVDANIGFKSVDVAAPGEAIATVAPIRNAGLSAEIEERKYHSRAIFNGIGFENIVNDDADYRQDAFDTAMEYLGISKYDDDKKILLVQDDLSNFSSTPSANKLAIYTELLRDYTEVDIIQAAADGGDGPTLATMKKYDAVIWFTGSADRLKISNLTVNDQQSLTDFLHGGGHLLLTGSNVLNGPTTSTSDQPSSIVHTPFVRDVLHLYFVEQYYYSRATGVEGSIYDNKEYPLDEDKDSYNWVISRDPSITKVDLIHVTPDFQGSKYIYARGTSIAAAHAAGAAALVLSKEPALNALSTKQRVVNSGTRLSTLAGRVASGRMINAYQALTDDEIPGTPFGGGSVTNYLDDKTDVNDVYSLELHAGEDISITMTGDAGTDFDLYLFSPEAVTVNRRDHMAAFSENDKTSSESIDYKVIKSGTYYLNAFAHKGSGNYKLTLKSSNQIGTYEDTSNALVFTGPWTVATGSAYSGSSIKEVDAPAKWSSPLSAAIFPGSVPRTLIKGLPMCI